jgi:two-component system cell cycle sensor histidine kinase/response regulator CckA
MMSETPSLPTPPGDYFTMAAVQALLDAQPNTAFLLDTAGHIIAANAAAAAALSTGSADELAGRDVFQLLPHGLAAVRRAHFDRAIASGQAQSFDDDHAGRRLRSTIQPVFDNAGKLTWLAIVAVDNTDQARAESALKVSLEKYKILFETFPLGITISDGFGRIIEANEASERLLGLPRDEQKARNISGPEWRIVRRDGTPMLPEEYASAVALRERRVVQNQEMGVRRGDGDTIWLSVSAAPIPVEGFGVAITYSDITPRKRAEEALQSAEQKYRAMFDHMAEGIALHRIIRDERGQAINYQVTDINPQYETIVGLRRERVLNKLATEVYGTATPPYLEEFTSVSKTGKVLRFQTYFQPMDKHFSISVVPLGPDGFATIFFDISALKRSQQEHEKLIALVESSNDFIGLATLEGQVLYLNEAARRLSGLKPDESVAGINISDFASPDEHTWFKERVLPTMGDRGSWEGVATIHNPRTGEMVAVDINVFAIPSRDTGKPMCLATVMRDITERERAREERKRLEDQLRQAQKMETVGRLAGGVAHDFNNMLTSILGNVELVLDTIDPADPIHAPLTDVRKAGESAASLTRQLLAFSRKQLIEPKLLNLNALITDMDWMLRRIIGEDITLVTNPSATLSSVRADAGQMEQAIVNLVVNGRDAMPDGGRLVIETADVEIDAEYCRRNSQARPGRYVRLSVSDTGTGISEEARDHVFEPFFTTKSKGTGLGLAMVYGAVNQNGGFVDFSSEFGHGATFRIHLPALSEAAEPAVVRARTEAPEGKETILLVEDDALVRELARRILTRLGYMVLAHENGVKAIQAAERHEGPIHLLVTDVIMPGMNGRELAVHLVARRPSIRTLFSSGYTDDIVVHHGLVDAGLQFLGKPYTPQALAAKVRAVLDA